MLEMDNSLVLIIGLVFLVIGLITLAFTIAEIVGKWLIFRKAKEDGWKAIIPIYNEYVMCKIVGVNPWWMVIIAVFFVLSLFTSVFATLFSASLIYFRVLISLSLAKSFGKSEGFGILTFFFRPICELILAFDKSEYLGPKPLNDFILDTILNDKKVSNDSFLNQKSNSSDLNFCSNCGFKIDSDSKFCSKCGNQIR